MNPSYFNISAFFVALNDINIDPFPFLAFWKFHHGSPVNPLLQISLQKTGA